MVNVNIPDKLFSNVVKIGILVIVVVMVGSFLKPTITGSYIENINSLNKTATSCKDKLALCDSSFIQVNDSLTRLSSDFSDLTSDYQKCKDDSVVVNNAYVTLNDEYNKSMTELNAMKEEYDSMELELNQSQAVYDELADDLDELSRNSANTICCIKRVDNPSINYYAVSNNKVTCLEDGELALDCP